jgi:LytR cell envelope-related transcriptional attenuator
MAWLAAVVVFGLTILGVDVLRERISAWRTRRRAARGLPPVVWSIRRRLVTLGISLGALAAVFGILLVLRGGGASSSSKTNRLNVIPSTTTTVPATTTTSAAARPPQQVRVAVINASGVQSASRQKSNALNAIGYQTVGIANGAPRTGTGVGCRAGFEQEAKTLAKNVGGNATVEPFPNPPPPAAANADCVVELGRQGATPRTSGAPTQFPSRR